MDAEHDTAQQRKIVGVAVTVGVRVGVPVNVGVAVGEGVNVATWAWSTPVSNRRHAETRACTSSDRYAYRRTGLAGTNLVVSSGHTRFLVDVRNAMPLVTVETLAVYWWVPVT